MPVVTINADFEYGQKVYVIGITSTRNCPACNGKGRVNLGDEEFSCPKCQGQKIIYAGPEYWHVAFDITIGYIGKNDKGEVFYAPSSGSLQFKKDQLFLTEDEAKAECAKRNEKNGETD